MKILRTSPFLLAFAVFTGLGVGVAGAEAPMVEISEQSQSMPYQVALNEIYFPKTGLQQIPIQASLENLKTLTVDVILATKESAFLVLYPPNEAHNARNRRIVTDDIVVQASPGAAGSLSKRSGVFSVTPLGFAPGYYKVKVTNPMETLATAKEIRAMDGVKSADPQIAKVMEKRAVPNDPLFPQQWHLENTGQNTGTAGADLNVVSVWDTYKGLGQVIGIVDDGFETTHEDLAPGYIGSLSYDFNDDDNDPSPILADEDFHGTSCAGVAAARGFNSTGVCGVAPGASLAGLRLLGGAITDLQIASAVAHLNDSILIKSNSWGPPAIDLDGPGPLTQLALADAVENGRNGRGTVFLWAGGNSGGIGDDANYDGYANSIYAIGVAAVDDQAKQASYSEPGACLLVSAPSSSAGHQGITTTDIEGVGGYNSGSDPLFEPADLNYTSGFGGTSSATPAVAGVVALMLDANSALTSREIQNILVRTARQNDPADSDWIINGGGLHFNHKYGAGLVDAAAAVALARTAPDLAVLREDSFSATGLPLNIPENDPTGITVTIPVATSIRSLEHVVLVFSASHPWRGDLAVTLTSPAGTVSSLASVHIGDSGDDYPAWPFMTVRNWGEDPNGDWTLKVTDEAGGYIGSLTGATLNLYGTRTSSTTPNPPTGSDDVVVTIDSHLDGAKLPPGTIIVGGTASSSTTPLDRVEYRHFTFGTISQNTRPDLGWKRANGTDTWSFPANMVRGQHTFQIRAVNKGQDISFIETIKVLVR